MNIFLEVPAISIDPEISIMTMGYGVLQGRLFIKLGKRAGLTIWQFGYPTKNALKAWYSEFEQPQGSSTG